MGHSQFSFPLPIRIALAAGDTAEVWPGWSPKTFAADSNAWDLDNNGTFEWEPYFQTSVNPNLMTGVMYPAAHPEAIAVGASSNWDCRSNYSQFGPELAFLAPSNGSFYNMSIETTVTDPDALLAPITTSANLRRHREWTITEYICEENNRNSVDSTGKAGINVTLPGANSSK